MNYVFKSKDHPEANGRQAEPGDLSFHFYVPLEDGGKLTVLFGEYGFANIAGTLLAMLEDCPTIKRQALKIKEQLRKQ